MESFFVAVCESNRQMSNRIKGWIEEYGSKHDFFARVDLFQSAEEFFAVVEKDIFYDLILFDVALPRNRGANGSDLYGIRLAMQLRERVDCNRVFFGFVADDYECRMPLSELKPLNLRKKPIYKREMLADVQRARDILKLRKTFLTYKKGPFLERVNMQEITHFEERGNDVLVHTLSGRMHSFCATLEEIEIEYEDLQFVRCHSSYVVNTMTVIKYEEGMLTFRNGVTVEVENEYAKRFLKK